MSTCEYKMWMTARNFLSFWAAERGFEFKSHLHYVFLARPHVLGDTVLATQVIISSHVKITLEGFSELNGGGGLKFIILLVSSSRTKSPLPK